MREILFKAKRLDNGEWVEGYYVYCRKRHYILPVLNKAIGFDEREEEWIEIALDTLSQYTGLTDKNGKKIWENDICIIKDGTLDEEDGCFICKWDDCTARYILDGNGLTADFDNVDARDIEVIGNIFDNSELLEVE